MSKKGKEHLVPVWERRNLTLDEASVYTGIGVDKLREISNSEDCVLWVGTKRMLKRKQLEDYLDKCYKI